MIEQIGEPKEDLNNFVEDRLQDMALWICLECGHIWQLDPDGEVFTIWSHGSEAHG